MRIVELIIDEEDLYSGIDAVSIVERPAIERNFVALNEQKEYKFQKIDDDKRLLMGPLLIPNKTIYRKDGEEEYYIYFNRNTVRKAGELYLMRGNQNNATFEHMVEVEGLSLVESWFIEDKENDKSNSYGMDLPLGTWMGTMKVNNEEIWQDFVKTGKVMGFSIEGYFAEKINRPQENIQEELSAAQRLLRIKQTIIELESYTDYPQGATSNAKRALEWADKNGWGGCGTAVGKQRANQLAKREAITRDTIARMASFKRHQKNKDVPYSEGCGGLMWDAWGGTSGINWAINKLKEIDGKKD